MQWNLQITDTFGTRCFLAILFRGCPSSEVKNYRKVSIWYIEPCPLLFLLWSVLYRSVLYLRFHCIYILGVEVDE